MKELISRVAPGIVLSIIGLAVLIFGIQSGQGGIFILGGTALLFVGVVVLLNAFEIISNKISFVLSVLMIVGSGAMAYFNYESINGPIQFLKEKDRRYAHVIQRLKDIREAQVAHKKLTGAYVADFDSLINFIKYDSIPVVKKFGTVPDTLTEDEALAMGIISRDTSLIPAQEVIYKEEYLTTRLANHPLTIDSLPYVPFGDGEKFEMKAGKVERSGSGITVPVFLIVDAAPFDKSDVLIVGSMSDPSTAGNWKEEK